MQFFNNFFLLKNLSFLRICTDFSDFSDPSESAVASGIPRIFLYKKGSPFGLPEFCKKNGGGGWIRTIEGMAGRFTVYCI